MCWEGKCISSRMRGAAVQLEIPQRSALRDRVNGGWEARKFVGIN
jgi:hypothetical protein